MMAVPWIRVYIWEGANVYCVEWGAAGVANQFWARGAAAFAAGAYLWGSAPDVVL